MKEKKGPEDLIAHSGSSQWYLMGGREHKLEQKRISLYIRKAFLKKNIFQPEDSQKWNKLPR